MSEDLLSREFEYVEIGETVEMSAERDCGPFDEYVVGYFIKDDDGHYRFAANSDEPMTCKQLREAAKKCGLLNSN